MKSLKAGFGTVSGRSGISSVFLADVAYRDVGGLQINKIRIINFDARIRMGEEAFIKSRPYVRYYECNR